MVGADIHDLKTDTGIVVPDLVINIHLMHTEEIVTQWFRCWEAGEIDRLPIANDFIHTSPFGTIRGKETYLNLVRANKDKFLGYEFRVMDALYDPGKACIRYQAVQGDFQLEVSEWHYVEEEKISRVIAYYHIGEIREDRQLSHTG